MLTKAGDRMNGMELKGLRVSKGKTQDDMSTAIEKTLSAYGKKENGETAFTAEEMCIISRELEMDYAQFNRIFFDDKLPFGI